MPDVTIFHNPACGTSRNTLALIRHAGIEPTVIEYLKTPPTKEALRELVAAMGVPARSLLREKGTPYAELGLGEPHWTDEQLLDFIGQHPILMNRPVVVTPLGTKLCRPSEEVLELLPVNRLPPFVKEDGEAVQDDGVRRAAGGLTLRPASELDWPSIEALLKVNGLPVDGAREHLGAYIVAMAGGTVVGTAGIERHGEIGLLRSVAVLPERQKQGLGMAMLERMVADARTLGLSHLYLLTTTAADYFAGLGFTPQPRDSAPAALQASAEFRGACPASAALMVRSITSAG
jgi:arsenate reductase